jgi:hypothetical protein
MNRYSASANNIGGFNCYGKKQPETMTGVGLPMKKLRPLLALVVPLFLLVSHASSFINSWTSTTGRRK